MSVMISLLSERLFWLEGSVLTGTGAWDSGDSPVLAVGGISFFLSRDKFDSEEKKTLFFNIR